jgi:signal transduction histidine kinase
LIWAAVEPQPRFTGVCPTAKGVEKVWEVSLSPVFDASGKPFRVLSIARDITERTATVRQLAEAHKKLELVADELVRSNEDLERFASVAAHDLKSPVNTIVALSQMLTEGLYRAGG